MSYKKYLLVLCGLFILNCERNPTKPDNTLNEEIDLSHFSIDNYPRVDGSTSTSPLQTLIACKILDAEYRWFDFSGERFISVIWDSLAKEKVNYILGIPSSGTHGAYVNLINDSTDVILVAREPSTDEITLASSQGITIIAIPVALDAFVFILNIHNTVSSLSIEQIQDIYTGKFHNWKEVDGPDAIINPYQRNPNSGSQELMEQLVMKGLKMVEAPDFLMIETMMGAINSLDQDIYGIGYTVYYYYQFMAVHSNIKICQINKITPDPTTIMGRKYPFAAEVYAAIRSNLDSKRNAFLLWRWLQTRIGQKVVEESGYIPIR